MMRTLLVTTLLACGLLALMRHARETGMHPLRVSDEKKPLEEAKGEAAGRAGEGSAGNSEEDAALPDVPSDELSLRQWEQQDPAAAAGWIATLPEGVVSAEALQQIAASWANVDLPAALAWCSALPEGVRKEAATLSLAYEAARTDPIAALSAASTLPPTPERDSLLIHAVSQWAGTDSGAVRSWAETVPDANLRQHLLAAVAVALTDQNANAAATLAATALTPGEEQDRTVVAIIQRWAQTSPQDAASWVAQFPETPARAAATENLVALWTAKDSQAAGNWLRALPEDSLRKIGLTAYTQALGLR